MATISSLLTCSTPLQLPLHHYLPPLHHHQHPGRGATTTSEIEMAEIEITEIEIEEIEIVEIEIVEIRTTSLEMNEILMFGTLKRGRSGRRKRTVV